MIVIRRPLLRFDISSLNDYGIGLRPDCGLRYCSHCCCSSPQVRRHILYRAGTTLRTAQGGDGPCHSDGLLASQSPEGAEAVTAVHAQLNELSVGLREVLHQLHPSSIGDLKLTAALKQTV